MWQFLHKFVIYFIFIVAFISLLSNYTLIIDFEYINFAAAVELWASYYFVLVYGLCCNLNEALFAKLMIALL